MNPIEIATWPPLWVLLAGPTILGISSVTGLTALLISVRNQREKRRLDTIIKTMEAEQSVRYSEIHQSFVKARKGGTLLNLTEPRNDAEWEEREKVLTYLNHYELIGTALRMNLLSYSIYREWMGTVVVHTWNESVKFIDKSRCPESQSLGENEEENPKDYNQRLYENFQYLAERFATDLKLKCVPLDKNCSRFYETLSAGSND